MGLNESIKLALEIFKEVLGDKFDINRFNISYVKKNENKFKKLNKEEIGKFK